MTTSASAVHHALVSGVIAHGRTPALPDLAVTLGTSETEAAGALVELAAEHGVVLHPGTHEPWVLHPFALSPTPVVIVRGEERWYAPCVWCGFGVAALVGGECLLRTTYADTLEPARLRVHDGVLVDTGSFVHFPVPMATAWDNVIHTCQTMLLFAEEQGVTPWSARHGIGPGDVVEAERVARFATAWYGRHADPDWHKWSRAEASAMFAAHGLTHPVWELDPARGRF